FFREAKCRGSTASAEGTRLALPLPMQHSLYPPRATTSELALGSSPSQAAGTMDSYILVVSGVNPRGGDQIESAVVVRFGPVREATAQPHLKLHTVWDRIVQDAARR
ncbi:unnamed protein product, partial [Penicillium manginii]